MPDGAPRTAPPDELTLVVSDLHLSGDPELDDFYCDREFADFLRYHAERDERIHLVINGDFVDFLQSEAHGESRPERDLASPLWLSEAEAEQALIATAERHAIFFEALKQFLVGAGRRLSVLRGNHDLDVAFPLVQARLRALLGGAAAAIDFPHDALFDEATGLYIEHGAQYDPLNAIRDLRDPFLDRRRRRVEVPVGSVIVKVFWNRVEREFPYVDKIRPMIDSVTALVVQRPTYLLLRFDYFVDLLVGVLLASLAGFFRLRPRGGPPPTGSGDPRTLGQRLARPGSVGKWSALVVLTFLGYLVTRASLMWDQPALREGKMLKTILETLFLHFAASIGISFGTIIAARLIRRLLARAPLVSLLRNVIYRLLVAAAAGVFFYSLVRMFWIPMAGLTVFYVLLDAARTVNPTASDEGLIPQEPEVMAALRLLKHPRVKTVVFGHTHVPMQVDLPSGKRYVNSGTWVKVVDLRNARTAANELNTFVAIRNGSAELMSWRGTEPARHFGAPSVMPVLSAVA